MLYVVAWAIALTLGVMAKPAILSIIVGGAISTFAFSSRNLPTIRGKIHTLGIVKFVPIFLTMFLFACMWSAILYGIGRLFS